MYYCYFQSPFGKLLLTGNKLLESIHFPLKGKKKEPDKNLFYNEEPFLQVLNQLKAYFKGELTKFDLEFKIQGTDFQKQVWQELVKIGYGETTSYGEIAKKIGKILK